MMNPKREASDGEAPSASTTFTESQECVKFFCTALADLNRISEEQIKGLVTIATTITETGLALSSSKPHEAFKSTVGATGDELSALVEQLRRTPEAASQSQSHIRQQAELTRDIPPVGVNPQIMWAEVWTVLLVALQNSVEQQKQLSAMAVPMFTMAVAKLFSISH